MHWQICTYHVSLWVIEVKYLTLKKWQWQTDSLPFLSFYNELIALSDSFSSDIYLIRATVTNHWRKFNAKNSPLSPLITRLPSEESVTENVILRVLFDTSTIRQISALIRAWRAFPPTETLQRLQCVHPLELLPCLHDSGQYFNSLSL